MAKPIELQALMLEWREELLSSGRLAADEFPERHARYLAEAVAQGEPSVAHGKISQALLDLVEEAMEVAGRHGNVRHRGSEWTPPRPQRGQTTPNTGQSVGEVVEERAPQEESLPGPWASYDGDPPGPMNNLEAQVSDGQATIRWTPVSGSGTVAYRVTYNDEFRPYRPEAGTVLAQQVSSCVVPMPTSHALRYVQVWAHSGRTLHEARDNAPTPIANGVLIAQPSQVTIKEDHGQVFCRWTLPNSLGDYGAIDRVEVQRHLVVDDVVSTASERVEAEFGGFHDTGVEPGRDYLYRITAMARVDGAHLQSDVVEATVSIPAPLEPVEDLSCDRVEDATGRVSFTLEWTVPVAGVVRIYRTATELRGGYMGRTVRLAELPDAGLTAADELPHPLGAGSRPGSARMSGIGRPPGWPTMYLTPVTVLRDQAAIGTTTTSEASIPPPENFSVIERVYEQHLRFGWPHGADLVRVYVGPRGQQDPDEVMGGGAPLHELTEAQWRRSAAVTVHLPPQGATVIVRSGRSEAGRTVEGRPALAAYPGLLRLRYGCQQRKALFGKPSVEISVGMDDGQSMKPKPGWSPHFVLVFRPERLPLHSEDGTALVVEPKDGGGGPSQRWKVASLLHGPGMEVWRAQLPERKGYVRLFVAESPDRLAKLALIDPPVSSLRVG